MGYLSILIGILALGAMAYFGFSAYAPTVTMPESANHSITLSLPLEKTYLTVNKKIIQVELATTSEQQMQGLSKRRSLPLDQGMLFVLNNPETPGFWMKEMQFPIDIIWIDQNDTVVGVTENLKPESYPQSFTPPSPVLYVLEVNAGFVKQHNIQKGDIVKTSDLRN